MTTPDFTTAIIIDQTPALAFNSINNVQDWWSGEIEGSTDKLHAEFNYHYQDMHKCKIKIIELIPNKKVVWLVLENYFKFTKDKTEWTGTKMIFDIIEKDNKTELCFTHQGLVPEYECYDICYNAWTNYIQNNLRNLITTGKGQPSSNNNSQTEAEKKLESTIN